MLSGLENLIGSALAYAFGNQFIWFFAVLVFMGVIAILRVPFEIAVPFVIALLLFLLQGACGHRYHARSSFFSSTCFLSTVRQQLPRVRFSLAASFSSALFSSGAILNPMYSVFMLSPLDNQDCATLTPYNIYLQLPNHQNPASNYHYSNIPLSDNSVVHSS